MDEDGLEWAGKEDVPPRLRTTIPNRSFKEEQKNWYEKSMPTDYPSGDITVVQRHLAYRNRRDTALRQVKESLLSFNSIERRSWK